MLCRLSGFLAISFAFALAFASVAGAQIANGDFENGGTGWRTAGTGATYTFPTTGGNPTGYARIESPASGLSGGDFTIDQNFDCGVAGGKTTCRMSVDYKLDFISGTPGFGVVKILVDRILKFQSPASDHIPWTAVTFEAPCGAHNITLDLAITNNTSTHNWVACFDNATSMCEATTAVSMSSWGRLKLIYR